MIKSRARVAFLSVGLLIAALSAQAHEGDTDSLEKVLVESAATPGQHEALAKYYHGKAASERKKAAEHKAMGAAYGGTKMTIAQSEKEHCAKLVTLHESAAAEYDAMAAEHESLAKK
jgi:hypothetical protein